jgi:23S rRNA (cytidine1920-2'-O)/16S rRNA (cytidine1409-2'-O)-methyltransferase
MTSQKKIRLDQFLVEKNFAETRQKAQWLIRSGNVFVNDSIEDKPSTPTGPNANIRIKEKLPYVSRGGLKLVAAITTFNIQVKDKIALDIGASTGGFTDCLLQNGAAKVYAVDVGYGQLALQLRNNPKVTVMEKINARYLKPSDLPVQPNIVTIDVSFISLDKILPAVSEIIASNSEVIALIKPQFEAGIKNVKKGVVKDPEIHKQVIEKIKECANKNNLCPQAEPIESPLLGPEGNKEFLLYMRKI